MDKKILTILWTNADIETSRNMVMMYARNSMLNGWWDEVTVIIWGGTAKLVAENEDIQEHISIAAHAGVKFSACISCARNLGVIDKLESLDIEVKRWGEDMSKILQADGKLLSI